MSNDITVGYADRLSVAPADTLAVMISTPADEVDVDVVRLRHGDTNPAGPGFRVSAVEAVALQRVPGRVQRCYPGSFMIAEDLGLPLFPRGPITLAAWVQPTLPELEREQGILSLVAPDGGALVLGLLAGGQLALIRRRPDGGAEELCRAAASLGARVWTLVAATLDLAAGQASLIHAPRGFQQPDPVGWTGRIDLPAPGGDRFDVLVGASSAPLVAGAHRPVGAFNGKIEAPTLLAGALATETCVAVASGGRRLETLPDRLASWRFERAHGPHVPEATGRAPDGRLVNAPTQAVTGHAWRGDVLDPATDPSQYAAVHFHDDDLDDAGWQVDATVALPADLASGLYAVRLRAGDATDHVPFVVRPAGAASGSILVLLPTFTYLAYANERLIEQMIDTFGGGITDHEIVLGWHDRQIGGHPEYGYSLYDKHRDGSGVCFSSFRRPILNLRPDYRFWLQEAPRNFSADLYLIDWLDEQGYAYDVITDHDLHALGAEALADHDIVLTGSHPEYVSQVMLDALEGHLGAGGSLAYLGGNGFYWVTSVDPERPHLIEVRRGQAGTRSWESPPGETYHSTTGEPGGLWRHRGRGPNALVGVGFAAQGWDSHAPGYRRQADSYRPEAAFVFEGIDDEVIGDFGLVQNGACADEIDRWDAALGSSPDALVLATSTGHSDFYVQVVEDIPTTHLRISGTTSRDVRADMVLVEQPAGGAVFSASAISFLGSLSHNGYDNNVSHLLANVLGEFMRRPGKRSARERVHEIAPS